MLLSLLTSVCIQSVKEKQSFYACYQFFITTEKYLNNKLAY